MKNIIRKIKRNSFRIYAVGDKASFETAFAISKEALLTAYHVVDPDRVGSHELAIHLLSPEGKKCVGRLGKYDSEADLATIEISSSMSIENPLEFTDTMPDISQPCIWGGFPILIGEHTPRLRYAKGMVSSEVTSIQGGLFFEVDGIFSPGHSGSAIIDSDTGKVIGVASRSAGELSDLFIEARTNLEAVNAISSVWQLFDDTRQQMQEIVTSLEKMIPIIDKSFSELYQAIYGFGGSRWHGITPDFPRIPFPSYRVWHMYEEGEISKRAAEILSNNKIDVHSYQGEDLISGNTVFYRSLSADSDVAWKTLIRLFIRWTSLMEEAINASFQMGIGIASCGKPLLELGTNI